MRPLSLARMRPLYLRVASSLVISNGLRQLICINLNGTLIRNMMFREGLEGIQVINPNIDGVLRIREIREPGSVYTESAGG